MIKAVLLKILLIFLSISVGFTQNISFDSLSLYYQNEIKKGDSEKVTEEMLAREIEKIPSKKISSFSEFKYPMNLLAVAESNEQYQLGIQLLSKLIPLSKSHDEFQAFLFYTLGQFYQASNESIKALECYLKASSLLEKIQAYSTLAHTFYKIGIINMNGWNNAISIEYADKGLTIFDKFQKYSRSDSLTLLGLYEIKGVAYRRTQYFDRSLKNIEKAIELATALDESVRLTINNGNKATIHYQKGDFEKAIPLLEKDFETSIKAGIYNSGMNALIYLSWIYMEMDNMDSLHYVYEKMLEIDQKYPITDPKTKTDFLKIGAKVAETKGDTAKANQYLRQYIEEDKLRDSINLSNDVASLHERHLMEQEISKLELLQSTNQLQASHLKLRTALLIIIAVALLVVLWYVFMLRNKNKKIDRLNEMLEAKVSERTARLLEINKELDTYLYRASHDIRRPIRTLLGLNNIAQINADPELMKQLFNKVHLTAMSMDKMLFKLQMAYELNNSHDIEMVEISKLVSECTEDMSMEIEEHQAKVSVNISEKAKSIRANKSLLRIALDNILENALLYRREEKNEIEIFTDLGNYYFYIHVKDNGYGIPEQYIDDLFNPYFKISNKTQGSGLGLFLAHKAISFLAGEIAVSSTVNEGSQFTVKIPVNPK